MKIALLALLGLVLGVLGGAAPVNPFAAGKTPAGQSPNSKKS